MPLDNGQKSGKTVQTLITSKKSVQKDTNEEKPSKRDCKRTHSDVSEESMTVDMASLQADLHDIKNTLESSVKKTGMQEMVTTINGKLLKDQREQIISEISEKLRENTGKLQYQIDTLFIENNNLKENLREKDRVIKQLQDSASESQYKASEAVRLCNFNEQYSRKHNIRILNLPEKKEMKIHTMSSQPL